jgi:pyruvate formate lyase activating enzyme
VSPTPSAREARYWETGEAGRVGCLLCPNACSIAQGRYGTCGVRFNEGGRLTLPFHGRISSLALDPVEKKPLYHFHPGKRILSVGFVGCSLRCGFCQNWEISQSTDMPLQSMEPEDPAETAPRKGSFAVAYTYSEPVVHAEYVLEAASAAKRKGIANVLVTNGYVNPGPAEDLLEVLDAANIDLKAFDPAFYREECGGGLEPVKELIRRAVGRIHVEVTTLVIPGKNDSVEQVDGIARFLAALSPDVPLHLSAYYPRYRYSIPPTPEKTVLDLCVTARRHLRYVYAGNVGQGGQDTVCPGCGAVVVSRRGYEISLGAIRPAPGGAECTSCGSRIPMVGLSENAS